MAHAEFLDRYYGAPTIPVFDELGIFDQPVFVNGCNLHDNCFNCQLPIEHCPAWNKVKTYKGRISE